jgi:hypothetical protein
MFLGLYRMGTLPPDPGSAGNSLQPLYPLDENPECLDCEPPPLTYLKAGELYFDEISPRALGAACILRSPYSTADGRL